MEKNPAERIFEEEDGKGSCGVGADTIDLEEFSVDDIPARHGTEASSGAGCTAPETPADGAAGAEPDVQKSDAGQQPKTGRELKKEKKAAKKAKKEEKHSRHPALYNLLDWVRVIVIALAAALFLNYFVIINSTVPSGSMEPTIMTGTRMIGFRLSYAFSEPERGDIIIFRYPDDTSQNFVKRIIGLPGETVEIIDGVTYIDGVELEEDYLSETPYEEDFGPYVVPEGCYFVMGDNRNNSRDSRYWDNTYVPEDYIIGKAVFCYWPLDSAGLLE